MTTTILAIAGAVALVSAASGQEPAYRERLRPQFHFTSRTGWLNDPNGLVFYKGLYHLFFQHNPSGNEWGNMTWGHATSPDLVHWTQAANAIEPDALGTIFSGSAVVDHANSAGLGSSAEKTLLAFYTAAGGTSEESKGQPFTQCLACSTDAGRTWEKFGGNPIVGHIEGANRDPKVVWYEPERKWIMALYLDGDRYALLESKDAKSWSKIQELPFEGRSECPDFFPMRAGSETKWVFMAANGDYLIGSFDGRQFTREAGPFVLDQGANFYATQTFSDTPGRRVQIAWMRGGVYPHMPFNQQMSFPCELTLRQTPAGLRIFRQPAGEISRLRESRWTLQDADIVPGANLLSEVAPGDLFDIHAEIEPGDADEISFQVMGQTISYRADDGTITFLGRSAILPQPVKKLDLRILIDRTSIELFAQGGEIGMSSCYVPQTGKTGIDLRATGGSARAPRITVFSLRSAWPD